MARCCSWCLQVLNTKIPRPRQVFCSPGCRDANTLFEELFSDEEINRRAHYWQLTHQNPPEEGGT
jgi:hypothetical protein